MGRAVVSMAGVESRELVEGREIWRRTPELGLGAAGGGRRAAEYQHSSTAATPATASTRRASFTMPLLRRRIRCHFCNQQSRAALAHAPRAYLCPQCDAVNHLDEVPDAPTRRLHCRDCATD